MKKKVSANSFYISHIKEKFNTMIIISSESYFLSRKEMKKKKNGTSLQQNKQGINTALNNSSCNTHTNISQTIIISKQVVADHPRRLCFAVSACHKAHYTVALTWEEITEKHKWLIVASLFQVFQLWEILNPDHTT